MTLLFTDEAWDDYLFWQKTDRRMLGRLNNLIRETTRDPFSGIGKPESLKHHLSGCWSRRIDREHRLVYEVANGQSVILSCRFHY